MRSEGEGLVSHRLPASAKGAHLPRAEQALRVLR